MRSMYKSKPQAGSMYDFANRKDVMKFMCGGKNYNYGGKMMVDGGVNYDLDEEEGDPDPKNYRGREARERRLEARAQMKRDVRQNARPKARERARGELMGTATAEFSGQGDIKGSEYYRPRKKARMESELLERAAELGIPQEAFGMTETREGIPNFIYNERLPGGGEVMASLFTEDMTDEELMDKINKYEEFSKLYTDYVNPTRQVNVIGRPDMDRPVRTPKYRAPRNWSFGRENAGRAGQRRPKVRCKKGLPCPAFAEKGAYG